jgi:hypothetical protein
MRPATARCSFVFLSPLFSHWTQHICYCTHFAVASSVPFPLSLPALCDPCLPLVTFTFICLQYRLASPDFLPCFSSRPPTGQQCHCTQKDTPRLRRCPPAPSLTKTAGCFKCRARGGPVGRHGGRPAAGCGRRAPKSARPRRAAAPAPRLDAFCTRGAPPGRFRRRRFHADA